MHAPSSGFAPRRRPALGLSMVELMVGLVLGLLLVIGVLSVYLTQSQAFRTNENLSRLQESARFALDLMAREIRDAAQLPCGSAIQANLLRQTGTGLVPAPAPWWADTYAGMVRGFGSHQAASGIVATGTGTADRLDNTDALLLLRVSGDEPDRTRIVAHDPVAGTLTLASTNGLRDATVVLACDGNSAALFQLASVTASTSTATYAGATLNCTADLGMVDAACTNTAPKTFQDPALLARWDPGLWYVGTNPQGGPSLYRLGTNVGSAGTTTRAYEIAPGVAGLSVEYLTRDLLAGGQPAGQWVMASSFSGGWNQASLQVAAVRLTLTLRATELTDDSQTPLERKIVAVVSLRN